MIRTALLLLAFAACTPSGEQAAVAEGSAPPSTEGSAEPVPTVEDEPELTLDSLSPPAPPASELDGREIALLPLATRLGRMRQYQQLGRVDAAIAYAHWANAESGEHQLELAELYARAGNVEAAIYWLRVGARETLSRPDYVTARPEFAEVRLHPLWPELLSTLETERQRWRESGHRVFQFVGPEPHVPPSTTGVLWMHGFGARPELVEDPFIAGVITRTGYAFAEVSATWPMGRTAFEWAEDLEHDGPHIAAAIEEFDASTRGDLDQLVLMGFSQGAKMAALYATSHPERVDGLLLLSPGGFADSFIDVEPDPAFAEIRVVILCGAGEPPMITELTDRLEARLRELGFQVERPRYPEMQRHSFPPDFAQAFESWLAWLTGATDAL